MADKLGREALRRLRVLGIFAACFCSFGAAHAAAQTAVDRTQAAAVASYVVQAGDVLSVLIYGWPTPSERLEGRFPVEANGFAHLPAVGAVEVAGKTTERLQAELRQRLAAEQSHAVLIIEPLFAVGINGEVRTPNVYDFRPGQTVFDAISRAGGYSEHANRRELLLVRDGKPQTLSAVNAGELAALLAQTSLQSGDRLMVQPRARIGLRHVVDFLQATIAGVTLYTLLSR